MKILLTGAAGFIGYHVSKRLCDRGNKVIGIDNLNDYYDVDLKIARLNKLSKFNNFLFLKMDISHKEDMQTLFEREKFDRVVHLAAQAGVRYSIENPNIYAESNLTGFLNILEGCRNEKVEHLVYASSSSVYGANNSSIHKETDNVDTPVSLYGATKRSNELMAYSYSHLYGIPTSGLRFFTVYGPWGRPDMSPFIFVKAILEDKPIKVFNHGKHRRDFTFIDDITEGIIRVLDLEPKLDSEQTKLNYINNALPSQAPCQIFNIGNSKPVELIYYIECIEKHLNKKAIKEMLPLQAGDVLNTYADTTKLEKYADYKPSTSIEDGVKKFVDWFKEYHDYTNKL